MGRWLEKITKTPEAVLLKPTQSDSVSFVSTDSTHFHKNVLTFVTQCCSGIEVAPQKVIDHLLSIQDECDIIHGIIESEILRAHIALWVAHGMPHYSDKQPS